MDPAENARPLAVRGARLVAAVLSAFVALGSAFGLSEGLRRRHSHLSHQLATPEDWFAISTAASPATVALGRKAFLASCAHCHGADATGDEGPDLHGVEGSNRYISNTILHGIKGEMPSFRKKLVAGDIANLTAYLRSLKPLGAD
jgi:mono/diheme cytochrome c family protein